MGLALTFDFLKFIFVLFIFFGPLITGAAVAAAVRSNAGTISTICNFFGALPGGQLCLVQQIMGTDATAAVAGAATAVAAGVFAGPVFEAIGIIMSMAVGFMGWLVFWLLFILLFISSRKRLFENGGRIVAIVAGFLVSVVPFLNAAPSFTLAIGHIVRGLRHEDKRANEAYATKQAELMSKVRQMQITEARQAIAARDLMEGQKTQAAEAEYLRNLEAANQPPGIHGRLAEAA